MTEAPEGDDFDVNLREIAITAGIVLVTIVAAMMVPAIREKVAELLQPKA